MKRISVLALVACLGLFVAACSAKRSLVGRWEQIGGTEKMEFIAGGALSMFAQGISVSGKYSFIDDNHLKLELDGLFALAGAQTLTFSISSGELSLTDAKGAVSKYRRVK